jgi:8-oxo-dGTP diphosphatase
VEPERLTGVYKNMTRGVVTLVFRYDAVRGTLTETDETTDCRSAGLDEVRALAAEAQALGVLDGLAPGDGRPLAVREHDRQVLR